MILGVGISGWESLCPGAVDYKKIDMAMTGKLRAMLKGKATWANDDGATRTMTSARVYREWRVAPFSNRGFGYKNWMVANDDCKCE